MLKTFKLLMSLRASVRTNLFIYYLQRVPLIGKVIPSTLYAKADLKKGIAAVTFVLSVLHGFATRFLYVGLMLYLPVLFLREDAAPADQLQWMAHLLFALSFIAAAVSSATILEPKREKYVAVKQIRISPESYMRSVLSYRYVTFAVYLFPALAVFAGLLGGSVADALLMTVSLALWRAGSELLHAKLYDKTGMVLIKQNAIVWTVMLIVFAAAYAPLLLDFAPPTGGLLLNGFAAAVISAVGLGLCVALARYRGFAGVVDAATKRDDPLLDLGRMIAEAQKNSVATKETDYDMAASGGSNGKREAGKGKTGYAYLNDIFFARHASLVRKPFVKRLLIVGVSAAILLILVVAGKERMEVLPPFVDVIVPVLVLAMYFLTVGEQLCRAMFYNCDAALLRYSFYREDSNRHFRLRLAKFMGMNATIAAALGAALTVIMLVRGNAVLGDIVFLWIGLLSLGIFFSVHHLFMYYIFQPFSTELNTKNPLYFIITMAVSTGSGLHLVLKPSVETFAAVWAALALIYAIVAIFAVRKYGARTFRVK